MRLRTLTGGHAGEIRDYGTVAARVALANGTAERLRDDEGPIRPPSSSRRGTKGRDGKGRFLTRT